MFGDIGIEKALLIFVVVLLLFGAKRLPEIGASMGKGIREFKRSIDDLHEGGAPPHPAPRADHTEPRVDPSDGEPKRLLH